MDFTMLFQNWMLLRISAELAREIDFPSIVTDCPDATAVSAASHSANFASACARVIAGIEFSHYFKELYTMIF
jgi:hypothetical protein